MVDPYLPDIIEGVVSRVDAAFSARSTDPFNVFFEKGLYNQVGRDMQASDPTYSNFPLVWLTMPYDMKTGNWRIYGLATVNLRIIMKTSPTLTQQERETNIYKPRLLPIYQVLMEEIAREKWFSFPGPKQIKHRPILLPHNGLGDVNGSSAKNLFNNDVDQLILVGLELPIKLQNCKVGDYPINNNTNYPAPESILSFEDDIELIVDRGNSDDPVSGTNSVIVPRLLGKQYKVIQRGIGQLRTDRDAEVADDTVNGGFSFLTDYKFQKGETFFIKIRPAFVANVAGEYGALKNQVTTFFVEQN